MAYTICFTAQIKYATDFLQHTHDFSAYNLTSILSQNWIDAIYFSLPFYGLFCALISILLFPFLEMQWARFIFFLLTSSILLIHFLQRAGHNTHLIVWVLFFGALIPNINPQNSISILNLRAYIRTMQIQILLIYAIAGGWKLFYYLKSFFDSNLAVGKNFLIYSIAHEFLESGEVSKFSEFLVTCPWLLQILSLGALLMQSLSVVVIFFPKYYFIWGLIICFFHIGTMTKMVWPNSRRCSQKA